MVSAGISKSLGYTNSRILKIDDSIILDLEERQK
jgi:hypothetical protein